MTTLSVFPPAPLPPNDPTWLDLDARLGWRIADTTPAASVMTGEVITLAPASGSRTLDEPSGSLGGLTTPSLVALALDGNLYLLDATAGELKQFDVCSCSFVRCPCIGGSGQRARQVNAPRAITISRDNLFVADTGNRRLLVLALRELVLRGVWRAPPPGSPLLPADVPITAEWQPTAVIADRRGRILVADEANGCIHRFTPTGRWIGIIPNTGPVAALARDRAGRIYALRDGLPYVMVFDTFGDRLSDITTVAEAAGRFDPLPFVVDRLGRLLFDGCGTYDASGTRISESGSPPALRYVPSGRLITAALDSALYQCQWHRVILTAAVPPGTSVNVATYSADIELPNIDVTALPLGAWASAATARAVRCEWDCLVRSPRGRYLWLALTFTGSGEDTPRVERIRVEFPRVSLRRYLPAVFGEDPSASDFTDRFLAIFDTTMRSVERQIDLQSRLFDARTSPARAPSGNIDFLTWLASWVGIALDRQLPEAQRRRFLRAAPALYDARGTRHGLWQLLLAYLGLPGVPARPACECGDPHRTCAAPRPSCEPVPAPKPYVPPPLLLEHFQLRRWLYVGSGRLGDDAQLWGRRIVNRSALGANAQAGRSQLITSGEPARDPFGVYASRFSVFVPARLGQSERQRKNLERVLQLESPAHTQYQIEYVDPRFRIGVQSMIGLDAVVGRYPTRLAMGQTSLGRDSVLGASVSAGSGDDRAGPTLRIGARSQIGTTTVLD